MNLWFIQIVTGLCRNWIWQESVIISFGLHTMPTSLIFLIFILYGSIPVKEDYPEMVWIWI